MSKQKPSSIPELTSEIPRERVIQDDGAFLLVSTKGLPYAHTSGLLIRRCALSMSAPFGYECLGQYRQLRKSLWHACLDSRIPDVDGRTERSTGIYASELDALVNLWASRRLPQLAPLL